MGKRNSYYGSFASFNPIDVNGLNLYLNRNNATPSSWLDQSPNAYDFVQAVGTKQPVISANSVDFDGADDVLRKVIANPFSGDNTGIMFFSGYYDSSSQNRLLNTANDGATNRYLDFEIRTGGKFGINYLNSSGSGRVVSTNSVSNGAYYYGYVESIGSSWVISLNGVIETPVIQAGTNSGGWFADQTSQDGISLGALFTSSPIYSHSKMSGVLYSNASLTSEEKDDINNFFSDPTNFQ